MRISRVMLALMLTWLSGASVRVAEGWQAKGCVLQPIGQGTSVDGVLSATDCQSSDGPYYTDAYTFNGLAGQSISISLTAAGFDPYLLLIGPTGKVIAEDDDSGPELNARIPANGLRTLTVSGSYRIEVSTFRMRATGSYSLRLDNAQTSPPPLVQSTGGGPYRFVPLVPCRLVDTRAEGGKSGAFGPPFLPSRAVRVVPVLQGGCDVAATATAYSLNITVVPRKPLAYMVVFPAGYAQPSSSTLNSMDGRIVANAAIVQAGTGGAISIFVTDDSDVIVDINGYLAP
jgi:hypothetical protein